MSRDGKRLLATSQLRDENLTLIGTTGNSPFFPFADALSPDGARVYELTGANQSTPASVHILDGATARDPLIELSSLFLADNPGLPISMVSLDGRSLFVVGDVAFIVQPL